ncbi:tripartite tricarboxylate transporter substrate binding protein [Siccirubricoccus sp. KC 17139]|uniref:Tripartite tricarboxylate transporter substrate binding protein n=1 Tax=Siccirubricoccus soli TaxID=2899147 RepID=A0ABT1D1D6_9PROT|nr:tripartite tricarboxylate transporter substrate binding protein [Siccirubricoccus soli]MCO6415457.1 tripartite tricarboxylate transporter substrate binding protein [Siccirubricoccus soli]MCP2681589.1 tripartite tricarboxylate transporter substrate binding protein [Siccirubricoccus soli]
MLRRLALLLALLLPALPAFGQAWPDRPVRLVVPYAAGGATDVGARVLAEALGQVLPQPVVVENRVGGAGMIAAEFVARAAPDGHTILFNNTAHAVLRVVVPNAAIDPIRQLLPTVILSEMPMVMLVANSFPAADGRAFIAAVRAAPGRYDFGSTGGGGTLGMAALLFRRTAGLEMNEIPYRGGAPATLDLAAGRIALVFDVALTAFQTAKGGQARAFAVTSPERSPAAPEVPTWREIGVDAEMLVWQALFLPAGTPAPVRAALHAAVARVQQTEAVKRKWTELGVDRVLALSPEESERYVAREVERWEALMR